MVRRSDRAAETGRHGAKLAPSLSVDKKKRGFGGRRRRSGGGNDADDLEEQQPGVLNLNNPLIPRELDEDIDDDLAFNSDDEEKYGQFFRKPAKPAPATKKSKKSKKSKLATHAADEDEDEALVRAQLRALGEIDDDEDLDFHDGDGDGGDDGDDEYIDLADMLGGDDDDNNNNKKKKKSKGKSYSDDEEVNTAKKKKKKKAKSVAEDGVAKKRRRLPVTEEAESIYGTAPTATATASADGAQTFRTAMRDLLRSTGKADASSEATTRLERVLKSKRNLIGVDVDDHTKAVTLRSEVREVVAKDLDRYKSFLREQREAKHVQLPMPMPESNPVPSTLGAIAAAAEARFVDETAAAKPASLGHSSNANRGNKASALRLAGTVHNLLTSAGISRSQLQGEADDSEGIVPFRDDDDEENGGGRFNVPSQGDAANAPTTSYMAKLKSMLSYENARRRRLNRIKSKTYRRIQRKEKEREKERRERAFELLNPEKARARLAEKLLKARVEERVTQKHKNTSKWVRHAKRFSQFDENTKDAINEQNMAHQRLMQKMEEDAEEDEYLNAGHDDAGSQAASSEEERVVDFLFQEASGTKPSENGAGNGQMDHINNNNNNKKKSLTSVLWRSIDDDDDDDNGAENGDGTTAGEAAKAKMTPTERARVDLREMKFMKQARMREETRYAAMLDQLKEDICRDMRGETVLSEDEPSDLDESGHARTAGEGDEKKEDGEEKNQTKGRQQSKKKPLPTCAVNASGRRAFQTAKSQQGEVLERIVLKRPTGINVEQSMREDADAVEKDNGTIHRNNAADDDASITDGDSSSGDDHSHSRRHNPNEKDSRAGTQPPGGQEDGNHPAKEKPSRSGKAKPAATDEFAGARAPGGGKSKTFSTRTTIFPTTNKRTRDDEINDTHNKSDNKDSIPSELAKSKKPKTHHADKTTDDSLRMHQDYLIARAFAHDDVDEEFLSAKAAQVEAVMKPTDKNATLPGWGEWGGTDERLNTRHQAKLKEIELKRNIERTMLMKSRADAALDHVIINHDGVELVPDRMLLHMIPRPFSNATEFARSMRHPTGPEWNSAIGFKDANQPRVEVRQGQAVMPLDLSLRGKKKAAKTTRRKSAKVAL